MPLQARLWLALLFVTFAKASQLEDAHAGSDNDPESEGDLSYELDPPLSSATS